MLRVQVVCLEVPQVVEPEAGTLVFQPLQPQVVNSVAEVARVDWTAQVSDEQ